MEFPGRGEVVIDNCTDNACTLKNTLFYIETVHGIGFIEMNYKKKSSSAEPYHWYVQIDVSKYIVQVRLTPYVTASKAICDTNCFNFDAINIVTQEYVNWK